MPSQVRYHKSTENIDDAERATVKPLGVSYGRFTVLERVLMVAVSVFIVLTIVFVVLYAANKTSGSTGNGDETEECATEKSTADPSGAQAQSIMTSLDWSVDPCNDFYKFSCNKWLSENDLPRGKPEISRFKEAGNIIHDLLLRKLQDKDTIRKYKNMPAVSKALKDFSACMKYVNITEEKKAEQTRKLIREYGGWNISTSGWSNDSWEFIPNLVKIRRNLDIHPLFVAKVGENIKNSSRHMLYIVQWASYERPRRMYLSNTTGESKAYKNLMLTVMAILANTTKNNSVIRKQMNEVFQFEKSLVETTLPREKALPISKRYHPVTLGELQNATGSTFNWLEYFQTLFQGTGVVITSETQVNMRSPVYVMKNLTRLLETTDKTVIANYMMWEVILKTYQYFPRVVSEEFSKYLAAIKYYWAVRLANQARNKICFHHVRDLFGLPLSILIMDDFGSDKFQQVKDMAERIKNVHINDMKTSWIDSDTRRTAVKKAKAMKQQIAFAKILFDHDKLNAKYAGLKINSDDHLGNWISKQKYKMKRILEKLLQPVDKDRALFDDFAAQGYYSNPANKMGVTTGLLQPPFFDASRPMSLNYGGVGMIIGHEITHSVDVDGRTYDENGNLYDWWTNSSSMEFQKRTACLAKQYSQYSYEGSKLNIKSAMDEVISDNGGIKQAFQAYQKWNKEHNETELPALNLTNNQLFFIGSAQIMCSKYQPQSKPWEKHPPGLIRVIGMLSNYPEFSKAFKCPIGSRMNPKSKCSVW